MGIRRIGQGATSSHTGIALSPCRESLLCFLCQKLFSKSSLGPSSKVRGGAKPLQVLQRDLEPDK